jgi:uncharacterized repeat protein (TIGR03803 family)
VIQATDGRFYGTTAGGGTFGYGTVFRLDASGTLTTLHSFNVGDGADPRAGLIQGSDGSFYGTTRVGGADRYGRFGTIFRLDASGTLTTLHSFNGIDGAKPYAELIQGSDGSFYGTSLSGGTLGYGTVFRFDTSGILATLYTFSSSDGAHPGARLIQAGNGSFYGTTARGGDQFGSSLGEGTIFKLDPSGTLTTFHRFDGKDGQALWGELTAASDGSLYGTASQAGPEGGGVVFRLRLDGGAR